MLYELPIELVQEILENTDYTTQLKLISTCKYFNKYLEPYNVINGLIATNIRMKNHIYNTVNVVYFYKNNIPSITYRKLKYVFDMIWKESYQCMNNIRIKTDLRDYDAESNAYVCPRSVVVEDFTDTDINVLTKLGFFLYLLEHKDYFNKQYNLCWF